MVTLGSFHFGTNAYLLDVDLRSEEGKKPDEALKIGMALQTKVGENIFGGSSIPGSSIGEKIKIFETTTQVLRTGDFGPTLYLLVLGGSSQLISG